MNLISPHPAVTFPGIEVHAIAPSDPAGGLTMKLAHGPPPRSTDAIDAEWSRQTALNPRLYSGPLLAIISIDFERGEFLCRRDEFKRLVVQPRAMTGVRLLAVCGLLTATDSSGEEHVLLGRRGPSTRIYPGLWETVPAGGVTPPPLNVTMLDEESLRANLREEMLEEIGVGFDIGEPFALVRDHVAFSDDIAFRIRAGRLEDAKSTIAAGKGVTAWEYSETQWMPIAEIARFDREHGAEIIAAARGLFRVMGVAQDG